MMPTSKVAIGKVLCFMSQSVLPASLSLPETQDNWRKQAISQVCAFHSPFQPILSDMGIYHQLSFRGVYYQQRCLHDGFE
jgi:hypothetical protein